jgi:hypothetical protein
MINVKLYNALVRVFKEVRIANEEEAAVFGSPRLTAVQNSIKNKYKDRRDLMPTRIYGGEQYMVCCPYCNDSRYRLYISHAWDKYLEDEKGNQIYAGKRALCHNENCLADVANFQDLDTLIRENLKDDDNAPLRCSTDVEEFSSRVVQLPSGFPLADDRVPNDIHEYLTKRGYDVRDMSDNWHVRVSDIHFYPTPALIFPIYQSGVCKCWQARYVGEDFKSLGKPKYFWPSGVKKSWLLYNWDAAKLHQLVVVTEGVLDAIRVGEQGVALFGKSPSLYQEKLLSNNWKNGCLIWMPDEDDPESVQAAIEYTQKWNGKGVFKHGAHVVRLPDGDPGDHSRRTLWNLVAEEIPSLSRYVDAIIPSASGTVG